MGLPSSNPQSVKDCQLHFRKWGKSGRTSRASWQSFPSLRKFCISSFFLLAKKLTVCFTGMFQNVWGSHSATKIRKAGRN